MSESTMNKPPPGPRPRPGPAKDNGKSDTKSLRKACNHRCVNKNVYPFLKKKWFVLNARTHCIDANHHSLYDEQC